MSGRKKKGRSPQMRDGRTRVDRKIQSSSSQQVITSSNLIPTPTVTEFMMVKAVPAHLSPKGSPGDYVINCVLGVPGLSSVDADHGNSPLSIIEIPQVLARGGVMPETTRSAWASPPW
jgi:hypothetical protein